jgi:hypothetical protein
MDDKYGRHLGRYVWMVTNGDQSLPAQRIMVKQNPWSEAMAKSLSGIYPLVI